LFKLVSGFTHCEIRRATFNWQGAYNNVCPCGVKHNHKFGSAPKSAALRKSLATHHRQHREGQYSPWPERNIVRCLFAMTARAKTVTPPDAATRPYTDE
jgi:hypothetical protein